MHTALECRNFQGVQGRDIILEFAGRHGSKRLAFLYLFQMSAFESWVWNGIERDEIVLSLAHNLCVAFHLTFGEGAGRDADFGTVTDKGIENATDRSVKDCESTVNKVVRIFRNPYFLDAETYLWVRNVYTGFGMSSFAQHTLVLDGFLNGLVIDDSVFNQLAGIDAIVLIDATELHAGAFNNAQGRGIFISGFVNTSHFAHKRFRNNMLACFNMCRHGASPFSMNYRKAYKGFRLHPIRYSMPYGIIRF